VLPVSIQLEINLNDLSIRHPFAWPKLYVKNMHCICVYDSCFTVRVLMYFHEIIFHDNI
jgi:hypothetical protein